MVQSFWRAAGISAAAYSGALLLGFLVDFKYAFAALLVLQATWTVFCGFRFVQLRVGGSYKVDVEEYGFASGGLVSSVVLLGVMVVLTQVV